MIGLPANMIDLTPFCSSTVARLLPRTRPTTKRRPTSRRLLTSKRLTASLPTASPPINSNRTNINSQATTTTVAARLTPPRDISSNRPILAAHHKLTQEEGILADQVALTATAASARLSSAAALLHGRRTRQAWACLAASALRLPVLSAPMS
jgi:hypothetical protein